MMGLVSLPISALLYWLVLRPKREAPFPKGGIIRLVIAGAVSLVRWQRQGTLDVPVRRNA